MTLVLAVGLLAAGAALLVLGTEWFMGSAGALAGRLRLSVVAVGFLLAGAEPEELVTGVTASASGHPTLAVGDVIGANITMLTLGLGLAALVLPLPMSRVVRSYALLATAAGLCATAALRNLLVGRVEGTALLAAYVVVVAVVWRNQRTPPLFGEVAESLEDDPGEVAPRRRVPAPLMVLLGLAAMAAGGLAAVGGASRLAAVGGLGERATGLTALAFATSVEVLALVAAARRHQVSEVAVAGVFGAVIYNATATLGAAALTRPLVMPDLVLVSVLATVLPVLVVLLARRGPVPRWAGGVLLLAYAGYLAATLG